MSGDEILRPTVVKSLGVSGVDSYQIDVDADSLKTYLDRRGNPRFKFTTYGIVISGPLSAIVRENTHLAVTRRDIETTRDNHLPTRKGRVDARRRAELFEEFYVRTRKVNRSK